METFFENCCAFSCIGELGWGDLCPPSVDRKNKEIFKLAFFLGSFHTSSYGNFAKGRCVSGLAKGRGHD
jgi:hypothetical protein